MDLFEERHLKTVDDFRHEYIIADTPEARSAMAAELEKYDSWCFDTETTGLNPLMDNLLGVSFALNRTRHGTCLSPVRRIWKRSGRSWKAPQRR